MNQEWHLKLLKLMLTARAAGKRESILFRQGKAHITASSAGHEAIMAIFYLLEKEDYLYSYYRDSHLMLAKGLSLEYIANDFFAKISSTSQGRSSSAHSGSREYKIFPTSATTASQCLPAAGTAHGQKLDKSKNITLCTIGDAATRGGEFYEAICYAVQEKLPIIFLIEDNHYGISTATVKLLPFRLNIFNPDLFVKLDGSNVFSIYDFARTIIQNVRNGQGPSILWCDIDRLDSHTCSDDHKLYRSTEELANLRDPIKIYIDILIELKYLTNEQHEELWENVQEEVKSIYQKAFLQPEPNPKDIGLYLYGERIQHKKLNYNNNYQDLNMVEAINIALELGLRNNEKLLIFGQDVEDCKGGVFGFTKGLSTKYPERVVNAPIAEATIIGTAVGLAVHGYRPVFEIQFIDFITPGFNQLVTNVSSLRWRSCSQWQCPIVLYAAYGAYLPSGGLWHSQSNEGWWTHIPGLRIAIPCTPEDALGMFLAAFEDQDPSLILIPKHIFRIKSSVVNSLPIPFGKARIVQAGKDVTIIGWGNAIELIQNASKEVEKWNISVEIIDLRTLVPCDFTAIINSLKKTKRLIVVQEDSKTSSFGGSIITEILTNQNNFNYLHSSPKLVTRSDIHIPYHHLLEYEVLPSVQDVVKAVKEILE